MSIQRTHKQSAAQFKMSVPRSQSERDLEKRLKLLNQQLYGKSEDKPKIKHSTPNSSPSQTFRLPLNNVKIADSTFESASNTGYLKTDLSKIMILTTAAMGAQLLLYYLIQQNIVNLNFLSLSF